MIEHIGGPEKRFVPNPLSPLPSLSRLLKTSWPKFLTPALPKIIVFAHLAFISHTERQRPRPPGRAATLLSYEPV